MDQHATGKWLIHGTKHNEGNQLDTWNSSLEYPCWENEFDINGCGGKTSNSIF